MREKWVIDRRTGKVVPANKYVPPEVDRGPIVIRDIEPYKSMITGERIQSRRHHRDHLRAHGCIEAAGQKLKCIDKPLPPMESSIKTAIEQLRAGYRGE